MRVVVVGGGITGLAAAWFLRDRADVTVFEAGSRAGGKIRTDDFGGIAVEAGPDAFLARTPDAIDLCREMGLGDELVPPAAGEAFLWTRGRLRPLPPGLMLGVPTELWPVARSGILPVGALARAALDFVLPRSKWSDDPSVGDIVSARFGRGVHQRLVDPLVGGIHAGRSELLSARATTPQLAAPASVSRSLMLGLRRQRRAAPPSSGPVFLTVQGGLDRLVDRLVGRLDVRLDTPVTKIERGPSGGGWLVDGEPADAVILATDAGPAAALVKASSPRAAAELEAIPYASVVVTTMSYPAIPLTGSGFLVPRIEGRLMTACTFGSTKWPQWAEPGQVTLRVSAGRDDDDRAMQLSDDDLVDALHAELTEAIGVRERPTRTRVTRWPNGFAQYRPGHLERVDRIEAALADDMPGVVVAGAPYRGVGIPACIASARRASATASEFVQSTGV